MHAVSAVSRAHLFAAFFCCEFLPAPVPRSTTPFGTDTCRPFGWGSQQLSEENPNFVREMCMYEALAATQVTAAECGLGLRERKFGARKRRR